MGCHSNRGILLFSSVSLGQVVHQFLILVCTLITLMHKSELDSLRLQHTRGSKVESDNLAYQALVITKRIISGLGTCTQVGYRLCIHICPHIKPRVTVSSVFAISACLSDKFADFESLQSSTDESTSEFTDEPTTCNPTGSCTTGWDKVDIGSNFGKDDVQQR